MLQSSSKLAKSGISKDKEHKKRKRDYITQCRTKGFGEHSSKAGCILSIDRIIPFLAQVNRALPNATDPLLSSFPGNLESSQAHHTPFSSFSLVFASEALARETKGPSFLLPRPCRLGEAQRAVGKRMIISLLL